MVAWIQSGFIPHISPQIPMTFSRCRSPFNNPLSFRHGSKKDIAKLVHVTVAPGARTCLAALMTTELDVPMISNQANTSKQRKPSTVNAVAGVEERARR